MTNPIIMSMWFSAPDADSSDSDCKANGQETAETSSGDSAQFTRQAEAPIVPLPAPEMGTQQSEDILT